MTAHITRASASSRNKTVKLKKLSAACSKVANQSDTVDLSGLVTFDMPCYVCISKAKAITFVTQKFANCSNIDENMPHFMLNLCTAVSYFLKQNACCDRFGVTHPQIAMAILIMIF